jgi:dTDP-glucose 4,6-dehydratase
MGTLRCTPSPRATGGNVNPVGPRGVYDEAKRFAEAMTLAYRQTHAVNTGILRIFNTFGPRMRPNDGRAIPNFIRQALRNEPLTVAGDGSQTRSICYVDDLVAGVLALADSAEPGPHQPRQPARTVGARSREVGHRSHRVVLDGHLR